MLKNLGTLIVLTAFGAGFLVGPRTVEIGEAVEPSEAGVVLGAYCADVSNVQRWICFGSIGDSTPSDCTACGCKKRNYAIANTNATNGTALTVCNFTDACTFQEPADVACDAR